MKRFPIIEKDLGDNDSGGLPELGQPLALGLLLVIVGILLILFTPLKVIPETFPLSQLGSAIVGSGFGVISTGLLIKRFQRYVRHTVNHVSDQVFAAVTIASGKNPNLQEIGEEILAYKFHYWRSIERDAGRCWRFAEIPWQKFGTMPFLVATCPIYDPAGKRSTYSYLAVKSKGRLTCFVSHAEAGEPAAVFSHVLDAPASELYGAGLLKTWTNESAISASILSRDKLHAVDLNATSRISIDDGLKLSEQWIEYNDSVLIVPGDEKI